MEQRINKNLILLISEVYLHGITMFTLVIPSQTAKNKQKKTTNKN